MNNGIKTLTEKFVTELTALVRRDVLDELSANLSGVTRAVTAAPAKDPANAQKPRSGNGNGAAKPPMPRRTRTEIEEISQGIVQQVCALPGLSIVDLSKRLKKPTRELSRSLSELKTGGLLVSRGIKSGMRYYPAERVNQ